tara:strand:- start:613 stop:846 length:234 start_codon:yes stop_codon:yes gene_type:complete
MKPTTMSKSASVSQDAPPPAESGTTHVPGPTLGDMAVEAEAQAQTRLEHPILLRIEHHIPHRIPTLMTDDQLQMTDD